MRPLSTLPLAALLAANAAAQTPTLPPLPPPVGIPKPGPVGNGPYAPQPIVPGGVVVPLYPPGSPFLKADRVREAEVYTVSQTVPGRINSVVNIHNPSIEFHAVDRSMNTGAAVILVPGGGHSTLVMGSEGADFVPFFYQYGVNTAILRYRLRRDGYNAETDAVNDAQQAIRMVRAYAKAWNVDPNRIGIIGFSAGAELSAPSALSFDEFDRKNNAPSDPFAGVSSRPDFVGIIYPGPTPFSVRNPTGPSTSWARNPSPPPIPRNAPPAFIATAGSGDRIHALWAMDYANAMLDAGVPNVEIHVYGNGRHPGDSLSDGGRMTGGLSAANTRPMSTWQYRFIDWFRDLGFLSKPGVETKAARDVAAFASQRR
jgi:endo-1,4-beta-xylanase